MLFSATSLLFALSALISVSAAPTPEINDAPPDVRRRRGCGSHRSDADVASAQRTFETHRLSPPSEDSTAVIDVYFHVVHANKTIEGGYVPDSQITAQISRLNQDYASSKLSFRLVNTTRINNQAWFLGVGPEMAGEVELKTRHRHGNESTLNVWTVGFREGDAQSLLGYATFPDAYTQAPQMDGVVLLYQTMPGGSHPTYNMGRTLTHETGHWMGLYHTFQGGCKGEGDEVDDTPAEATPSYGCAKNRDTCPSPGLDPITNFMDYSDDSCMEGFTPGQTRRLRSQLATYRNVRFTAPDGTPDNQEER